MKNKNSKPIISLRDGKFDISVWSHEIDEKETFSLKLRKSWKGNSDKWEENSINFSQFDLSRVIMLLSTSYHEIIDYRNLK